MPGDRLYAKEGMEFARAVTFFDAIFAFAVTLLITTVDDFSPQAWSSPAALWAANGPSLISFTISFLVVVSFWRANHRVVAEMTALNSRVITLNCVVMFGVVLIPFTTEALGKVGLPLSVAVYAAVIAVTAILHHLVQDQADRAQLVDRQRTPAQRRWDWISASVLPAVFLASIPVAYLASPAAAEYCWISLVVLNPLVGRWAETRSRSADAGGPHAPTR